MAGRAPERSTRYCTNDATGLVLENLRYFYMSFSNRIEIHAKIIFGGAIKMSYQAKVKRVTIQWDGISP